MTDDRRAPGDASNVDTESPEEALARARDHAIAAVREGLAAVHALLDAGSLAVSGEPARAQSLLAPVAGMLERLVAALEGSDDAEARSLLRAIADALDAEIARWETRARDDVEARSVLRAFLGLREVLWEFGVRPAPEGPTDPDPRSTRRATRSKRRGGRVQRIPVEG